MEEKMSKTSGKVGEKLVYEYAVIRYVPDVERGEFVNVGLMMMCKRKKWLRVKLIEDWNRVRCFFPKTDLTLARNQLAMFLRDDVPSRGLPVEERYRWMAAVKSAVIQTSPSHPGLLLPDSSSSLESTFDRLFRTIVT